MGKEETMRGWFVRGLGLLGVVGLLVVSLVVARPVLGAVIGADDEVEDEQPQTTRLLYPLAANGFGIATTIVVTNTSADPFGSEPKSGSCTFTFFSNNGVPDPLVTGTLEPGQVYSFNVADHTNGLFGGYVIAECGFPLARGVAYTSDDGGVLLTGSYTAEIIGDERPGS